MLEAMQQQYEDFKLLTDIEAMASAPPPPPPLRVAPSPPPRRSAIFYATEKQSLPNAIEVELLSTLVVAVSGVHVATNLMRAVDAEAANIESLGIAWTHRSHRRRSLRSTWTRHPCSIKPNLAYWGSSARPLVP